MDYKVCAKDILALLKQCDSSHITCDLCKWERYGKCLAEEAFRLAKYVPESEKEKLPTYLK